ncbi:transmembrane matrix receptor MUP-4-like [Saccostrea cucullata]|uniref:transmembrane matrix receptor MUP-4-like n=1 Tax=Saccostrea cuccullata TaxID=36930 RepID=UPI002ED11171
MNNGSCVSLPEDFKCMCSKGWTGKLCEDDIDECSWEVCGLKGLCTNTIGSFNCSCFSGVGGTICNRDYDECNSNPCSNGGVCINMVGHFQCVCPKGYSGSVCDTDIDECLGYPCENNGSCINTVGSYACICPKGWTGDRCQNDIDECLQYGCVNGGTCINTQGSSHCQCNPFFTGTHCEEDINECVTTSGICKHGGTCKTRVVGITATVHVDIKAQNVMEVNIDECELKPCKNGGNCTNTNGSFYCNCTSSWTGYTCEKDVNECRPYPGPCINGSCNDFDGGFKCICDSGFTGVFCEINVDECLSNPCTNNGSCVDVSGSFLCECINDWGGPLCEIDLCKTIHAQIVFAMDSSLSTTESILKEQVHFVSEVIKRITVSEEKFDIALVSYGSDALIDIPFGAYNKSVALLDQVSNISSINGTTDIFKACQTLKQILSRKQYTSQFVLFLTDGMPSNLQLAVSAMTSLRYQMQSTMPMNDVILVEVGEDIRHEGLRRLSSDGDGKNVFSHVNMDALHHIFSKLVNAKCSACKEQRSFDLILALDTSSVQHKNTFTSSLSIFKTILQKLQQNFVLGENDLQIGAVHISSEPFLVTRLNHSQDINNFAGVFLKSEQDSKQMNSTPDVAKGLRFISSEALSLKNGGRKNSRKYIIHTFTGYDKNTTESIKETRKLTNENVTVISIGIGEKFDNTDVLQTASSAYFVFFSEKRKDTLWHITETDLKFMLKFEHVYCSNRINA